MQCWTGRETGFVGGTSLFFLDNRRVAGVKVDARAGLFPGLKAYVPESSTGSWVRGHAPPR